MTAPREAPLTRPSRRVVGGCLALGAVGVAVIAILSAPGLKVVERGRLVTYTEHEVVRYRAFDDVTFLAAPETDADEDGLNSLLLAALGGVAALATLLTWDAGADRHLVSFFGLVALGAVGLALAEIFELDETLGYNVQWVDRVPGLTAENLDLLLLAPPAVLFLWHFRDVLLSCAAAMWFWLVAMSLFFVSLALDLQFDTPLEDRIEVVASLFLLAGFTVLAHDRLRTPRVPPEPNAGTG